MAKIQLNGKKVVINSKYSILDLLKKYNFANKKIAVEINKNFFGSLLNFIEVDFTPIISSSLISWNPYTVSYPSVQNMAPM